VDTTVFGPVHFGCRPTIEPADDERR
jgi:hypothetical protein